MRCLAYAFKAIFKSRITLPCFGGGSKLSIAKRLPPPFGKWHWINSDEISRRTAVWDVNGGIMAGRSNLDDQTENGDD